MSTIGRRGGWIRGAGELIATGNWPRTAPAVAPAHPD